MLKSLLAALALAATVPQHVATASTPPIHPTGLRLSRLVTRPALRVGAVGFEPVDLRQDAPPIRDQQQTNACASFATTEVATAMQAMAGQPMPSTAAPMYQFVQINGPGNNAGTSFQDNLDIEETGAEPANLYSYGPQAALTDYTDTPTAADHTAATPYRITGYNELAGTGQPGVGIGQAGLDAIYSYLASSHKPLVIGFTVTESYMRWSGSGAIAPGGQMVYGRHANAVFGVDAQGDLIALNSWGTSWGQQGYAILSPAFVEQMVEEAWTVNGVVTRAAPSPTPSPSPEPTATPSPTATPVPPTATPTPTPRPRPTATIPVPPPPPPSPVPPTATPQPTPKPSPTLAPRHHPKPRKPRHCLPWPLQFVCSR